MFPCSVPSGWCRGAGARVGEGDAVCCRFDAKNSKTARLGREAALSYTGASSLDGFKNL